MSDKIIKKALALQQPRSVTEFVNKWKEVLKDLEYFESKIGKTPGAQERYDLMKACAEKVRRRHGL